MPEDFATFCGYISSLLLINKWAQIPLLSKSNHTMDYAQKHKDTVHMVLKAHLKVEELYKRGQ